MVADDVTKLLVRCHKDFCRLSYSAGISVHNVSSNFITSSTSATCSNRFDNWQRPRNPMSSHTPDLLLVHIYASNKQGRSMWQGLTALMLCFAVLDAHHRLYCNTESLHDVSQPRRLARTGRKRKCMAPVFQGKDLNGLLACVCTMDWKLDSSTCISTGMLFYGMLQ